MRESYKSNKLYADLKDAIVSGRYASGSRLGSEAELAEMLKVSRNTLRTALSRLEDEKLVTRIQKKGTFVRNSKPVSPITFILPCPHFLSYTGYSSSFLTHAIFQGATRAAHELNTRVETIGVSLTNLEKDIDLNRINCINENSNVLLAGAAWYEKMFPTLHERGCRVAMLNSNYYKGEYHEITKDWIVMTKNSYALGELAVKHLVESGCRKIVLATAFANDKNNQLFIAGYKAGLRLAGLKEEYIPLNNDVESRSAIQNTMNLFWKKHQFDGVVFDVPRYHPDNDYRLSFNRNIGIPDSVKVITRADNEDNIRYVPALSSVDFPHFRMGYDSARLLFAENYVPCNKVYEPVLRVRESTSMNTQEEELILNGNHAEFAALL